MLKDSVAFGNPIMFLYYIINCAYLLTTFVDALPSEVRSTNRYDGLLKRGTERNVRLVFYVESDEMFTTSKGDSYFPNHSALFIEGSDTEGPLKLDLETWSTENGGPKNYGVGVKDFGVDQKDRKMGNKVEDGEIRVVLLQGKTDKTNREFFDVKSKTGIFLDAINEDPQYRYGTSNNGNLNTCHDLNKRILEKYLNIPVTQSSPAQKWFDTYSAWTESTTSEVGAKAHISSIYLLDKGRRQIPGTSVSIEDPGCKKMSKRAGACSPLPNGKDVPRKAAGTTLDMSEIAGPNELSADTKVQDTTFGKDGGPKTSILKVNGRLKSFATVGKDALVALGVAGDLIGAAFIIIDFVDHNWVGGAIGLTGLAAGVATAAAISGPLGWVVGGAIATFFAILPLAFKDPKPPADRTNVQQIIQWKMFGDKEHTGNEKCQEDHDDVKGNKDCQALYGPGTLTMALGFNNFDSIAFLIYFNDGYAMSIQDVASKFYVIDEHKAGDGSDQIATITCHNKKGTAAGKAGVVGGDKGNVCDNPTFQLNRALITLHHLNESGDKVFNRIIPAPGGDCKLITYPGDTSFPNYGFTLTGIPSAIACGLNAGINVGEGKIIPVDGDDNGKPLTPGSDAAQSTDGQGGACVKPPDKATSPFKPLAQEDYLCLFKASNPPFCLPPGTYGRQHGLGFEIKDVDSLTLPGFPGLTQWGLKTHWKWENQAHQRKTKYDDREYKANQDPTKKSNDLTKFKDDMKQMDMNESGESTFTVEGPGDGPDPVCCLFSEPNFGGNVWCVGEGGGDTLPQWSNVAQSVSCHAGAQVTLYAKEYGDCGGAVIRENLEDLKNEPFGNQKDTFSKNVKALWVAKS